DEESAAAFEPQHGIVVVHGAGVAPAAAAGAPQRALGREVRDARRAERVQPYRALAEDELGAATQGGDVEGGVEIEAEQAARARERDQPPLVAVLEIGAREPQAQRAAPVETDGDDATQAARHVHEVAKFADRDSHHHVAATETPAPYLPQPAGLGGARRRDEQRETERELNGLHGCP